MKLQTVTMPNISFFIAAYNCAATIAESVNSIMETNFTVGDELIIVNDCSTDNTDDLLKSLNDKYAQIKILNHKRNKGGAAARNTAVENSTNRLLFCLDSDNILTPESIRPLKEYLLTNKADVASFQYQSYFYNDPLKQEYEWSLPEGIFDIESYFNGKNTPGQHGNYLFTKQSWENAKGYAEGTGALDTWTFGIRQAITGAKMVVLKDTRYYHRLDHVNSYWMRDAEANLWTISIKAAHGLYPFFERIDEKYLDYMFGRGRYSWFQNRNKRPIKLVSAESKEDFYIRIRQKLAAMIYPKAKFTTKVINKIKRMFL